MNKAALAAILEDEGIHSNAYGLDGGHPSEAYVLAEDGYVWSVYYSERGLETSKRTFPSEAEACLHLLTVLRGDSTARRS